MALSTPVALALLVLPALQVAWSVYGTIRCGMGVETVPRDAPAPASWPRLSVIVPARDEAETIEAATRAKLGCDYPNLEVVIVDDRSTDGTGAIADRLAETDSRVKVVHLTELPSGWLGKVHALDRGVAASTGTWLLFSDADVHLGPTLLRRLVATCEARRLDFVPLLPEVWPSTFWLDVALTTFLRTLCVFGRIWKIGDPRSRAAVGGGSFNLVRRSALDASPGLAWFKLDIADDVVLAQMLKRSGARCAIFNGRGEVKLYFCRSLRELAGVLEKNGFTMLGGYSLVRHVAVTLLLLYLDLAPAVALASSLPEVRLVGCGLTLATVASTVVLARWARRPLCSAFVPWVGNTLVLAFMFRSAIVTTLRGGVVWRGTRYPLEELRRASRLTLF